MELLKDNRYDAKKSLRELVELTKEPYFSSRQRAVEELHNRKYSVVEISNMTGFREHEVRYFVEHCC